jgi:hypothetical protein
MLHVYYMRFKIFYIKSTYNPSSGVLVKLEASMLLDILACILYKTYRVSWKEVSMLEHPRITSNTALNPGILSCLIYRAVIASPCSSISIRDQVRITPKQLEQTGYWIYWLLDVGSFQPRDIKEVPAHSSI